MRRQARPRPLHIFGPLRDTRLAKDKTPYKNHLGAFTEGKAGPCAIAPRGSTRDHLRIDLLRRNGLIAGRQFAPTKWLATRAALDRITDSWRTCAPLLGWLDPHVGPTEVPPENAW